MSTFILTGTSGYIGAAFLAAASDRRHHIIAIDKKPLPQGLQPSVFISGDLSDEKTISELETAISAAPPHPLYWLHFAALFPKSFDTRDDIQWSAFEADNIQATRNLFNFASNYDRSRFFFFPSTALLDRGNDAAASQLNHYGKSKSIIEEELSKSAKLKTIVWRLPRIIGTPTKTVYALPTRKPDIARMHQTIGLLKEQKQLPDDIISTFMYNATADENDPQLIITNPALKRSYAHVSDLIGNILNLIDKESISAQLADSSSLPFQVEEVSIQQIAFFITSEMQRCLIPCRVVQQVNGEYKEITELEFYESSDSIVQRAIGEYFSILFQEMNKSRK